MCGIAGVYHYGEPGQTADREALQRITRALAHRGPDGEGFFVEGPLGLGHRRLAIVDLSETGRQPMASSGGSCWISYNGEFYTHREARRRLESKGVRFRGSSDTETLVNLLQEEGLRGLRDPSAIFAFAFWDGRRRELALARDPLGVKQLYYHDDGRRVVFASEIKALLQWSDVPRRPDLEAINQYLHFHTPLFDRTFFEGIRQVEPGQAVVFSEGRRQVRTWWRLDVTDPLHRSDEEAVEELKSTLADVVRDQLLSDVPVGAFFSGGIDSSAVAAFAARGGYRPKLFGVHFVNQGVVDEGPFQEAAAKAMGLDLQLMTVDPSSFPEDLARLLEIQDQPVIGPALIPMYHVSKLASQQVKVCLGGQAADEIFGGYARYALARPWSVVRSWFTGRRSAAFAGRGPRVGGNLGKQLFEGRTLRRLAANAGLFGSWQERYFDNFASVPETAWARLFPGAGVSRRACWEVFTDRIRSNSVRDPATAAMLWDVQTYLPGLFQQDDRMSMANSLESRVPLADPRLVRLAFRTDFGLKFRAGASKWILRQAVADAIPAEVLNRRKVGFDTPAEAWMRGPHAGFVRETLLSKAARERGLLDAKGVEALLANPEDPHAFTQTWKALCIEIWAQRFLGQAPEHDAWRREPARREPKPGWRDYVQEIRELGPGETFFRANWEFQHRSGLKAAVPRSVPRLASSAADSARRKLRTLGVFGMAEGNSIPPAARERLAHLAREAGQGRIFCFSRWWGDFGDPLDWHLNPVSRARWRSNVHWSLALRDEARVGDVKLTWELGRFPQAFHLARAGAFHPRQREDCARIFRAHVESFVSQNPPGMGVHWASGQELVFRLIAWLFALQVFQGTDVLGDDFLSAIVDHFHQVGHHLEGNLDYARKSVYNNHLLSEALGLLILGELLSEAPRAERWRETGMRLLDEQAGVQFAPDGGYIQNSHTYHRVALQILLMAEVWGRAQGRTMLPSIREALTHSVDFLVAHQNPADGRLPNYGPNDGSLPLVLSTCDYADFRPILQAANLAVRGQRLFGEGPWDETAAWLLGPESLAAPLAAPERRSVSFMHSGYHVLRGRNPGNFGAVRAGSLRQRFSQIDMLHLDVWWKGLNVLVDGGTFLYNGPPRWHDYFLRTGSHNTLQVDGRDQMLHLRRFKSVYLTQANSIGVREVSDRREVEGEHFGYRRHQGGIVHRRQVFFLPDDLWVVADSLSGEGEHLVRLQWLGAPYPHASQEGGLRLETPEGPFVVRSYTVDGRSLKASIVSGGEDPPRGWISRYYGEKLPAPSLAFEFRARVPVTVISVLSGGEARVEVVAGGWTVEHPCGKIRFSCTSAGIEVR